MKKIILLFVVVLTSLSSCNYDDEYPHYGFQLISMNGVDTYWENAYLGAKEKCDELGHGISWRKPSSTMNVASQVEMINKLVENRSSGIILAPIEINQAMREALASADYYRVPVCIVDSKIENFDCVTQVSTDNIDAGNRMAHFANNLNIDGKTAILSVSPEVKSVNKRVTGFINNLDDSDILPIKYHDNNLIIATSQIDDLLIENSDLKLIFATNSIGTAAAAKQLEISSRNDIFLLGFDNTTENIEALENGIIDALAVQNQAEMGYKAVEMLDFYYSGLGEVVHNITTNIFIVTLENINTPEAQEALYPFGK